MNGLAEPPLYFRIAQVAVSLQLIAFTVFSFRGGAGGIFLIVNFFALLGLWLRVAWGRFLCSCAIIFYAVVVVAHLLPDIDDQGTSLLEGWFGTIPPLWLSLPIILRSVVVMLIPLVLLGWYRDGFEKRW